MKSIWVYVLCAITFIFGWIAKPENIIEAHERAKLSLEDRHFHTWLLSQADKDGNICVNVPELKNYKGGIVITPTLDSQGRYIDPHTGKLVSIFERNKK